MSAVGNSCRHASSSARNLTSTASRRRWRACRKAWRTHSAMVIRSWRAVRWSARYSSSSNRTCNLLVIMMSLIDSYSMSQTEISCAIPRTMLRGRIRPDTNADVERMIARAALDQGHLHLHACRFGERSRSAKSRLFQCFHGHFWLKSPLLGNAGRHFECL